MRDYCYLRWLLAAFLFHIPYTHQSECQTRNQEESKMLNFSFNIQFIQQKKTHDVYKVRQLMAGQWNESWVHIAHELVF